MGSHQNSKFVQKYHLKHFVVKVDKDESMRDVILQLLSQINLQLKEDNLDYEVLEDSNLYEIGFSKKNGKMKTDYPSTFY